MKKKVWMRLAAEIEDTRFLTIVGQISNTFTPIFDRDRRSESLRIIRKTTWYFCRRNDIFLTPAMEIFHVDPIQVIIKYKSLISSIVSVFNTNEFRRYSVSYNLFRDRLHNRVEWRHYLAEDFVYLTTDDESGFKFDLTNTNMISSIESVRKSICSKVENIVLAGGCCFLLLSVCCCFVIVLLYFDCDAFDSGDMRE